jgi:hypothetical protein
MDHPAIVGLNGESYVEVLAAGVVCMIRRFTQTRKGSLVCAFGRGIGAC